MSSSKMFKLCVALVFFLSACSFNKTAIADLSAANDCEQAEEKLSGMEFETKTLGHAKQAGGTVVSMVLTGAGYLQDSVLFVVGNVIAPVTICTLAVPFDVSMILYRGSRPGAIEACGKSWHQGKRPSTGSQTYEETSALRNVDLSPLSAAIRSVATCYQKRGDEANRTKALSLLHQIDHNENFFVGLNGDERHALQTQLRSLSAYSDIEPAASILPTIAKTPKNPLLSADEAQLLGVWHSEEGTILEAGEAKDLAAKKIAGVVDITIAKNEITINSVMSSKLPITFVTGDEKAKKFFKRELEDSREKRVAIIKFITSDIYEYYRISGDGKQMTSVRMMPSLSKDKNAQAQRVERSWIRLKK